MIFIRIWVNSKEDKEKVLEWLVLEIMLNGHISVFDVLTEFEGILFVENNDIFGYHEIGWNVKDLGYLMAFKKDIENTEFPTPKINFEPHYT